MLFHFFYFFKKRVGDIYAKEAVKKFGTEYIVGSPANILCKYWFCSICLLGTHSKVWKISSFIGSGSLGRHLACCEPSKNDQEKTIKQNHYVQLMHKVIGSKILLK